MNTIFKKVATGTAVLALSTTVFAGATFAAETVSPTASINGTPSAVVNNVVTSKLFTNVDLDGTTQNTLSADDGSYPIS